MYPPVMKRSQQRFPASLVGLAMYQATTLPDRKQMQRLSFLMRLRVQLLEMQGQIQRFNQ